MDAKIAPQGDNIAGDLTFEGLEAAAALAELYRSVRLFVNFFQPSFKLAEKSRDGAVVRKRYHAPATPCQRLLEDPRVTEEARARLRSMASGLDRFSCCATSARPSSIWWRLPTAPASVSTRRPRSRRWRSS